MDAGIRRRGREIALQVLYQVDAQGGRLTAQEALALHSGNFGRPTVDEAEPLPPGPAEVELSDGDLRAAREFAATLVQGALAGLTDIDALLTRASRNWRLDRMARVDRNLLRLAAQELRSADVPAKVVLNEAIEIAKRFGTAESSAFVNGILDRCLDELGRKTPRGPAGSGR
jgi:transcription antitermination protein NusB